MFTHIAQARLLRDGPEDPHRPRVCAGVEVQGVDLRVEQHVLVHLAPIMIFQGKNLYVQWEESSF